MDLIILPEGKEILDVAFRNARKQASRLKSQRNKIKDAKGRSIRKIEVAGNHVSGILGTAMQQFPSVKEMHPFYLELVKATIDLEKALKALGHMSAERKIIIKVKGNAIGRIKGLEKTEAGKADAIAREFYGRLSGLVKKLDGSIRDYNEAARKLRELPKVRFDVPTAIIAGYPNTGKSTVLGRLTKSRPKVAAYPFTTQKLEIGYLIHNYLAAQLIDTPGLLDRPLEKRNQLERKGIAALRHLANLVVFVADPTMQCGFPLEKQKALLEELESEFRDRIIVVINKADAANEEEMERAKKAFAGHEIFVEGNNLESGLRERIGRIAKQAAGKEG